ncbi:peptidoglycan DD-metalloendopeptidase family protein [Campylobacter sp. MIT 99-7217]|uniref:peptidoglycan DD-metalloendopeptidase family protein n=1 Tax=Campylobacter sp. MIT 99-7217 TaxID=535091 RepID=UPI00391812B8
MKTISLLILLSLSLFGASKLEEREWAKNEFFLKFLENNSLPLSLYYELDAQDKELASEIKEGVKFQILWGDNEDIEQVLIPINGSDLQIHIYKDMKDKYTLSLIPVSYQTQTRILSLNIESSAYQDIERVSKSTPLARAMRNAFGGSVDFKAMQKGDRVTLLYERKERMGERFGDIIIKMASVEINKKPRKVFLFNDAYFNKDGKEIESFLLVTPVKFTRISSYFTRARYHPILKRYRAHLGVDYAAKTGTPVVSAGKGTVSFVGVKGGYGKVVEIQHSSGYKTLYAHLSRFAKIKKGQSVSQGQTIAYVGSTGMSTGPHLHFGLYLNNQAINPLSVVRITKSELKGKKKEEFQKLMATYEDQVAKHLESNLGNPPQESIGFEKYIEFQ